MTVSNLTFHERVEDALHDAQLRRALDIATARFVENRRDALAALPEAEVLRDHGRRIRAHTLANLDTYLAQFAASVEGLGGHVHWAETAEDVTTYVTDLARARGVKNIVKSKSMVTEEVELNHALEAAGMRVVETDLGEYIAQLAGERPSHIVTPVIHKTRQDVAELFRDKLNASEEDLASVANMTALARRILRVDFLQADMGISGANFGVAENGAICLVTNEGNGRLATTIPRIHVVVMGIERLVPTVEDLGVMVQLLVRSSTGQKLTVYTNLITGPRRRAESPELDGPEELHVILVDHGRIKILGSELAEILYCIRCGSCLNACPVYQQIGGHAYGSVYSGPVGSVLTPGMDGVHAWGDLAHASSLCGACREVCPVRIDIPRLLLKLRNDSTRMSPTPLWLRLGIFGYRIAVVRPGLYRWGGRLAGWFTNLLARKGWLKKLPGPLGAWTKQRDFPAFARKSFNQQWREREARNKQSGDQAT